MPACTLLGTLVCNWIYCYSHQNVSFNSHFSVPVANVPRHTHAGDGDTDQGVRLCNGQDKGAATQTPGRIRQHRLCAHECHEVPAKLFS